MNQESKSRRFLFPILASTVLLLVGGSGGAVGEPGPRPALECPPCDDGNACTVDSCDTSTGVCVYAALICDDQNACTTDSCDAANGCVFTPLPEETACDDGNTCTAGDACDADGHCAGTPEPSGTECDDRNSCTLSDACDGAGACAGIPQTPGSSCDDGLGCSVNDVCVQGSTGGVTCQGTPRVCDDGNICTDDSCDPATGECVTQPVNCDDGSECTSDSCSPSQGCQHVTRTAVACDDHNPCTDFDRLSCVDNRLVCVGNVPPDCNDDRGCTIDTCSPTAGCQHTENCN